MVRDTILLAWGRWKSGYTVVVRSRILRAWCRSFLGRVLSALSALEVAMKPYAVMLGVKPCLRIECKFWLGDDGWNGSSESPPITVQSGSFEQAKSDMEIALGKYIESLMDEKRSATKTQAA